MSEPTQPPLPPWLAAHTARLAAAQRAGRLPHALLIHEDPGAGGEWLALWAARLALCSESDRAPCGACAACRRAAALRHPDLMLLGLVEESRQIRIEQVRELAADLALTSHAGGYKVGILSPADALNRFAANALLKTLEEPPPRTLLVLVATQPSRLPATVLSRCQRVRVGPPSRAEGVAWLTRTRGSGDWNAALEILGEAPMLLREADPVALVETATEVRQTLEQMLAGQADPLAVAERWARSDPALRLRCIENWLTERLRRGAREGGFMTEVRAGAYPASPRTVLNMRELFGLLDAVREMRAALEVPLNRALALEAFLRQLAPRGAGVAA